MFMEARKEPFIYEKIANVNYGTLSLELLLFMLQNSKKDKAKDSSIENPRGSSIENPRANMLKKVSRNGDIHHVRVSPDVSSLGRNSTTILNNFLNSGDFHHAAVLPVVSSLSGNRLWLPKRIRETCSGEMDKGAVCTRKDGYIGAIEKVGIPTIKIIFPLKIGYKGAICTRRDGYIGTIEKVGIIIITRHVSIVELAGILQQHVPILIYFDH